MIFLDVVISSRAKFFVYFIFLFSQVQIQFLQKCLINLNFVATFDTKCMLIAFYGIV